MSPTSPAALATELLDAYAQRRVMATPPSARDGGLDLATAYATEAAILRRRIADGHRPVGLKVGFASKAVWRALKLETLVWAHMYEDTVRRARDNHAELSIAPLVSPKIEPEIVLSVKHSIPPGGDAGAVLGAVDWIALGFEIIDCVFADWKFQPADFVAAKGLHAALVVGTPLPVTPDSLGDLADALASFTVSLDRNGETVATGGGRNVLRSPALCLGELAAAIERSGHRGALQPGELVSSGTLTESQPLGAGETWTATAEGLRLPALTLTTTG